MDQPFATFRLFILVLKIIFISKHSPFKAADLNSCPKICMWSNVQYIYLHHALPTQLKLLNTFSFIAEVTNRLSPTQLKLIMPLPYSIEADNASPLLN